MNLTITPVNVNHTFSHKNQTPNTAQNQNFGAMNVLYKTSPNQSPTVCRQIDTLTGKFLYHFETMAKKIGLNTDKLNQKGFQLEINSKDFDQFDDITVNLLDKDGKIIQNHCNPTRGFEEQDAKTFAKKIYNLKLTA